MDSFIFLCHSKKSRAPFKKKKRKKSLKKVKYKFKKRKWGGVEWSGVEWKMVRSEFMVRTVHRIDDE